MKLKYIIPLFIAAFALLVSCDENESVTLLEEIQVSSSYVAIPEKGGSVDITLTTLDSWKVKEKEVKVTNDKGETETKIVPDLPSWLTLSATSGSAGETKITFSAEATLDGRTAEIVVQSAERTQHINVIQGESKVEPATVAEAIAGPEGKTFRVTGVCTEIQNTQYGNWILEDETGSILVYGTLDAKGQSKNFLSLGIEVGDEVTIEGPRQSYNGSPQFVDVMMLKLNKSLVKVDSVENEVLPVDGGIFTAHLSVKGLGISVDIPENAKDWLSIASIESAGEEVTVNFQATPNMGGDRSTTIIFRTTDADSKKYSTEAFLSQKGSIIKASIAEFIEAEVGDAQYRLSGVITKIDEKYNDNIYIRDFSGETYVYRLDLDGKEYKEGDIVTIVGKRSEYKGTPQVDGAVLEEVKRVSPISIAEVLTKSDSKDIYYMVSGEITEIVSDLIGRVYLKDESGEIYVFGCSPGYGAVTNDEKNGLLEAKGIKLGDKLTVIGNKASYNGAGQLSGSFYYSHKSAE